MKYNIGLFHHWNQFGNLKSKIVDYPVDEFVKWLRLEDPSENYKDSLKK